ncbi:MAG: thioredoxin-dependent thiol peroxidase [Candidatus Diapherotrites archaeon]|nr:thioredoxin-dependent thiol peroxidase [Candidatus Diapherotrites archaeon]
MTSTGIPKAGEKTPLFNAKDTQGNNVGLQNFKGRKIVLYFYPKDMTSGCTVEACAFRDAHAQILESGAVVLGVSPDSADSHKKFSEKHDLTFPLLVDKDLALCKAFGAWGEKSMYGRKYFGVLRTTFIIDTRGRIARVFEKVKPEGHALEVLAALKEVQP